jgi:DNA-binding NarL/FixJ family response regulator
MTRIKVAILAEQQLIRDALRALLKSDRRLVVIADAGTRSAALSVVTQEKPDVILIDDAFPVGKDFRFLRDLSRATSEARIIALVDTLASDKNQALVSRGVKGLVSKDESAHLLVTAIEKVYNGELWFTRSETAKTLDALMPKLEVTKSLGSPFGLTPRELQVVKLVAEGLKNREIAERLHTKESTVRHQLSSVFDKCEVASRIELMLLAFKEGLVLGHG